MTALLDVALPLAGGSVSPGRGGIPPWRGKQSMAWAQDDMAIVAEMAEDCGISLPQSGLVREICRTLKPRRYKLEEYGK